MLDASGNGIVDEDVAPLLELYRLEILNLADNAIEDIAQVVCMRSRAHKFRRRHHVNTKLNIPHPITQLQP